MHAGVGTDAELDEWFVDVDGARSAPIARFQLAFFSDPFLPTPSVYKYSPNPNPHPYPDPNPDLFLIPIPIPIP